MDSTNQYQKGQYQGNKYKQGGNNYNSKPQQFNQKQNNYYKKDQYQEEESKEHQEKKNFKYNNNHKNESTNKNFGKPEASALVPRKDNTIKLYTNQYRVTLGQDLSVYQYEVAVVPEVLHDTFIINSIYKHISRKVEALLGLYVFAGKTVFTTTELNEDLIIDTQFRDTDFRVIVSVGSKKFFSGNQLNNSQMADHNVIHTLINNILKQAFRETNLRQIGRRANYFDMDKQVEIEGSSVVACPGFRATAFNYQKGMAIVLDNINKFLSNQSCLDRITEINSNKFVKDKRVDILREFQFKSIIGNWGHKKTYIVRDVIFNKNPLTYKFVNSKGEEMSIAQYFLKAYDMKITDTKQPLFQVRNNGQDCYIPPEFCIIDGVPDQIRQDSFKMRNILSSCRKDPNEKFDAIQNFAKDLFSQKALKNWGIEIQQDLELEAKPIELTSHILPQPLIQLANMKTQNGDQNMMRKLKIQKTPNLVQWAFVYDKANYSNANYVYQCMTQSSEQIGIQVSEPIWIEIEAPNDFYTFENVLPQIVAQTELQIAMIMVGKESLYSKFKHICYKNGVISQCLLFRTAKKFNASVASNVLRQMNSKVGGDLYNIKFNSGVKPMTMLIGIDVCHSGPNSIVGFCASINKELSQYYSNRIIQKKRQELVDRQLKEQLKNALSSFEKIQGDLPQHFIIYRDGVGDAMRRQIIQTEIAQFKDAIKESYNHCKTQPTITLVIVNKRISQRFFCEDQQGNLQNPPSGCLIDSTVVENEDSNTEFDFYLIPQHTTQGCVLPTHFYVAYNDSSLDKPTLEKLTFDLCHYYFNWAGPIKVPAPCMYAHKIAELFNNLGATVDTKKFDSKILESFHYL